jgi:cytochrome c oxidase subunit III
MYEGIAPYTVEAREDTGLYNARFGIWLFLASEVMLFGSIFSSYILLRTGASEWPVESTLLDVPIGALNTVLLICSSMTMVMSWVSLRLHDFKRFRLFLGSTIALAVFFLAFKTFEYREHFVRGQFPATSVFFALYFLMTGLHALHVVGGIAVNAYMLGPGRRLWFADPERFTNRLEVAGIYWHFVDIVWIFLFPTLYLL